MLGQTDTVIQPRLYRSCAAPQGLFDLAAGDPLSPWGMAMGYGYGDWACPLRPRASAVSDLPPVLEVFKAWRARCTSASR